MPMRPPCAALVTKQSLESIEAHLYDELQFVELILFFKRVARMEEAPHVSYYRRRAAELRAHAETTNNVTLKLEFIKIATSFDELADLAAKYPAQHLVS